MNLPEMGEKPSSRDTTTLELGSCWPSAPAATFCHGSAAARLKSTQLLQDGNSPGRAP